MMSHPNRSVTFSSLLNFAPASIARVKSKSKKTLLPPSYEPTPYSVILGGGKETFSSIGNRRLRVLVDIQLQNYSQGGTSKQEKSDMVTNIVHIIQEACPEGAFVKLENGQWWEVDDCAASEKVGAIIRDCLHGQYKSKSSTIMANTTARRKASTKNGKSIQHHDDRKADSSSCSVEE
jgi:hypothetical protein